MKNKKQHSLNILRSILEDKRDEDYILPFGYYLSSQRDHLYNLGFYIDEFENYKEFVLLFRKRCELCNNTLVLAKKYRNIWSDKGLYRIENNSVKIEIICDSLFSYSYSMNSQCDDSVVMDKELANSFSVNMINREFVNIKVVCRDGNTDYIDIYKKVNVSNYLERDMLNNIISMIETVCCVYNIKKNK